MTNVASVPTWMYPILMFGLLLVAGIAEYLHMIPIGIFGYILTLMIGLVAPSPFVLSHTHSDGTDGNMLPSAPVQTTTVIEPTKGA